MESRKKGESYKNINSFEMKYQWLFCSPLTALQLSISPYLIQFLVYTYIKATLKTSH